MPGGGPARPASKAQNGRWGITPKKSQVENQPPETFQPGTANRFKRLDRDGSDAGVAAPEPGESPENRHLQRFLS
jgi:hypothetical protein